MSTRDRACMRLAWPVLLLSAVAAGCGSGISDSPRASCPVSQQNALEAQMDATLGQAASGDFSFSVDRWDGRRYTYNRGGSTLQTSYESKSASKLVSAVIILRLVELGHLALSHQPQNYIDAWPTGGTLSGITLAQLLSFTSGLKSDPPCLENGSSNIEDCVSDIAQANDGNVPGQEFFYASAHLQVAGLMAVEARNVGWQAIFSEFKSQTGLFAASSYDWPSSPNPVLAGGMHFTGEDYMAFLKALKGGVLLNPTSMSQLLADRTAAPMPMTFSPIRTGIGNQPGLGEDWHYGFGLWHECQSATFNCVAGTRVSSVGALGTYPFWDRSKNYTGIVVRAGAFGTFPTAIAIERSVRPTVEAWAAC